MNGPRVQRARRGGWYRGLNAGPQVPCQWNTSRSRSGPFTIPEPIARAAYAEYAKRYGTSQSFERLHERGGFSPAEIIMHLADALGIEVPTTETSS